MSNNDAPKGSISAAETTEALERGSPFNTKFSIYNGN